jgi:hypothetical protein
MSPVIASVREKQYSNDPPAVMLWATVLFRLPSWKLGDDSEIWTLTIFTGTRVFARASSPKASMVHVVLLTPDVSVSELFAQTWFGTNSNVMHCGLQSQRVSVGAMLELGCAEGIKDCDGLEDVDGWSLGDCDGK